MSTSSNSTRRHSSGSSGRKQSSSTVKQTGNNSKFNLILIAVLTVIVIVAIIAGFLKKPGSTSTDTDSSTTSDVTVQQESDGTSLTVDENDDSLQENAYPEINTLISNYRKAFLDGDSDLLKEVYNSDQDINADILTATSKIIEAYNNTQVYTKHGRNTGEYVVFVYDELKIADIDTLAPNLSVFYVKTSDEGTLYIYRGEYNSSTGTYTYDADTQEFLQNLYEEQDVSDLITTVNTKMDSACANDSDLMEFMQKVRAKSATATTDVTTAETEAGTDSETEAETETESQEDAETEAADDEA